MRIISPFHDYYDSVQGQGFDDKVVYNRETRSYSNVWFEASRRFRSHTGAEVEAAIEEIKLLPAFHEVRPYLYDKDRHVCSPEGADAGLLCLAGRAYPFWVLPVWEDQPAVTSFEAGFDDLVEQAEKPRRRRRYESQTIDYTPWRDWQADHWGREIDPAIHFRHGSPIVLYIGPHRIIDPCLRDYGFQRKLDPFTVFQEIDMFLGGVMADIAEPPSPQTDKEKVLSHGMDVKRSFRNMPRP